MLCFPPAAREKKSASTKSIKRPAIASGDAETGDEVDPSEIIKGYEVGKGQYIELEPAESGVTHTTGGYDGSFCFGVGNSFMSSSIEYVRGGKLRALAVTTATRSPVLPDIPTVAEFVPDYESSFWSGVGAPKDTPAEIIDKLNREINAALADPQFKARLADLGGTALSGSPAEFGKFIASETEKWAKVVKFAGVKAD